MKYRKGQIIEEDGLKWKIDYLTNYPKKGYQFVSAHRVKKDGSLGKERISFESDRYHKTFHRYKGIFYKRR